MLALHAGLLMTVVTLCIQGSLSQCNHGDVRLVNGSASNEGVVVVCRNSKWGVVCAVDEWGRNDATVICRQLGYLSYALVDEYYDQDQQYYNHFDNVYSLDCDADRATSLVNCGHRTRDNDRWLCRINIAYLVCRDDKRVLNVSADHELITTASASNVHMVSVTWVQNTSAAEPTSFEVKCQNALKTVKFMVSNKTNSTAEQIYVSLLPSSSYNCCVSAVYRDVYVARERCTRNFETPDHEMTVGASNSTSVVGGVLGFFIVFLLVLLIISVVALVCVLRPSERLKNSALYGRLSRLDTTRSTTIPVSNNSSYVAQPPTSRAPHQAVRPANTTAARPEGGATAPNYSSIGPDYESIESRRQVELEPGSNRVNMRERYEFAEVHAETDGQNGVQESMDYEVPVPSASQSEDYSHLQH